MGRRIPPLVLAALLAASCAPGKEQIGAAKPNAQPVVRIANWSGAGDDGEYERLIQGFYADFEKEHNADVKVEGIPDGYVPKMLLNFTAGAQPDVMVLDASSAAVFINNGMLEDLSPFIERDPEVSLDDYFKNVVDIGRRGKAVYALPGDFTPMVLYYNKELFDKSGVPYPKPGWTFNEFLETAQKLTNKAENRFGFSFSNWMAGWIMWFWNNGGEILSPDGSQAKGYLDSKQNVETVTFLRDLINKHEVAPSLSHVASMGVDLFANGQAAMAVSGHWSLIGYKNAPKGKDGKPKIDWQKLGVVELPHNTPEPHTVMYESGFAMPKGSKNPELAWELIKMWSGYALQRKYNASGIAVCGRKDVAAERALEPLEQQFLPIIPSARPPYGSWREDYEIVEEIGKKMMDSVLNGKNPQEALTEAAERIDREFSKAG